MQTPNTLPRVEVGAPGSATAFARVLLQAGLPLVGVIGVVRDLVMQLISQHGADGPMSPADLIAWGMAVVKEATQAWAIETGAGSFRRN
jgi:hypothetical protein